MISHAHIEHEWIAKNDSQIQQDIPCMASWNAGQSSWKIWNDTIWCNYIQRCARDLADLKRHETSWSLRLSWQLQIKAFSFRRGFWSCTVCTGGSCTWVFYDVFSLIVQSWDVSILIMAHDLRCSHGVERSSHPRRSKALTFSTHQTSPMHQFKIIPEMDDVLWIIANYDLWIIVI